MTGTDDAYRHVLDDLYGFLSLLGQRFSQRQRDGIGIGPGADVAIRQVAQVVGCQLRGLRQRAFVLFGQRFAFLISTSDRVCHAPAGPIDRTRLMQSGRWSASANRTVARTAAAWAEPRHRSGNSAMDGFQPALSSRGASVRGFPRLADLLPRLVRSGSRSPATPSLLHRAFTSCS